MIRVPFDRHTRSGYSDRGLIEFHDGNVVPDHGYFWSMHRPCRGLFYVPRGEFLEWLMDHRCPMTLQWSFPHWYADFQDSDKDAAMMFKLVWGDTR